MKHIINTSTPNRSENVSVGEAAGLASVLHPRDNFYKRTAAVFWTCFFKCVYVCVSVHVLFFSSLPTPLLQGSPEMHSVRRRQ